MKVGLLVIDSLGAGAMDDVPKVRPQDAGANTLLHVAAGYTGFHVPTLEALGIGHLADSPFIKKVPSPLASFGMSNLAHEGADTFQGHQEIVGSRMRKPALRPFKERIHRIQSALVEAGYQVSIPDPAHPFLLVNGLVVLADNIEADPGLCYNVTAPLDFITFEEELQIGRIVRREADVSRVIVLGGREISIQDILGAVEQKVNGFTGVNCGRSGVYNTGYMVRHLGYGIDPACQVTTILQENGFPVTLIGKAADVIYCDGATYLPCVDTQEVMTLFIQELDRLSDGLVFANVQETDLAGHAQNVERYAQKLMEVDRFLPQVMQSLGPKDLLIITGDHGNDPTIGHSHHTREKTVLLVYSPQFGSRPLGERQTLADIGATIADYFGVKPPEMGESILKMSKG